MNKLQEELLKSIDMLIKERMDKLQYSYFLEGVVKTVNIDDTYIVTINGEEFTLKAIDDKSFIVGDIVDVCIKNGDFSRKFIAWKRVI